MKSRMFKRDLIFSTVYTSPLGFSTWQPFSTNSAASGISAVIIKSPFAARLTISLSATSKPGGTCTKLMSFEGGTRTAWFANSVSGILVRSLARNKISLTVPGQASPSTQICMDFFGLSVESSLLIEIYVSGFSLVDCSGRHLASIDI